MDSVQIVSSAVAPANIKTFKCVFVGDGGVGKTAYRTQLIHSRFVAKYVATLGVEVDQLFVNVRGNTIRFNIWDTAGQEKFGGLRDGYYIQADCAIVFFDLGSRITFKNASYWLRDVKKYTNKIVLVGNKEDLGKRKVSIEDIMKLTEGYIPYYEISCKTRESITGPIDELCGILGY
jgi:GTP-binding nuclear protein Ran